MCIFNSAQENVVLCVVLGNLCVISEYNISASVKPARIVLVRFYRVVVGF